MYSKFYLKYDGLKTKRALFVKLNYSDITSSKNISYSQHMKNETHDDDGHIKIIYDMYYNDNF